jgi:hypothetical protein
MNSETLIRQGNRKRAIFYKIEKSVGKIFVKKKVLCSGSEHLFDPGENCQSPGQSL